MSIHKLQLPNGQTKWLVRVWMNGRDSKRVSKRFDRRQDAEQFLLNVQNELKERKVNPYKPSFEDRTFGEEAEAWIQGGEIRFSPGTFLKASVIVQNLLPEYGDIPLSRFSPQVISRFQHAEKLKGLEDATVNRKCQVIMAILNHAVKQRRIPYNPAQGFTKLKEAQKEAKYWSREEASEFLAKMNAKYPFDSPRRWIYVAYLVALNTGLRSGEIWGLKPEDLSPIANVITVSRQLNAVTGLLGPTKSRRGRIVPCTQEVAHELKGVINYNARNGKFNQHSTIFVNERGGAIDYKNFYHRRFIPDIKTCGLRPIRFHDLRHTATTLMIASGVDVKTVKEICGHADISTTMNYVHLVAASVERVPLLFSLSPANANVNSVEKCATENRVFENAAVK